MFAPWNLIKAKYIFLKIIKEMVNRGFGLGLRGSGTQEVA